ncbi:hypothetical protein CRUP_013647 [Coryphaenoides rupestris]|nr:hypothetical protein CRUP_013647 [Coryphaenoides rupestris]
MSRFQPHPVPLKASLVEREVRKMSSVLLLMKSPGEETMKSKLELVEEDLPGHSTVPTVPGSAGGDYYHYDSDNSVNWQIKEYKRHLSPEEFHRVFGMSMASFDRLAQWKKKELKKEGLLMRRRLLWLCCCVETS